MSLDHFLKVTSVHSKTHKTVEGVVLFLPPEYEIGLDEWREMIRVFNKTDRKTKLAEYVKSYIQGLNPDNKDFEDILSVGEIQEKANGLFYTDLHFKNNKIGLTALVIFNAENLKLVPVSSPDGSSGIRHVVLTYIPD